MDDKENNNDSNDKKKSFPIKNSFSNNNSSQILDLKNEEKISSHLIERNISLQEKFSRKGVLPTIFDEKIKKQLKNENQKKIEDNKKLNSYNKEDFLKVRKIKKISESDFNLLYNEIIGNDDLNTLYKDIINYGFLALNEIDFSSNVGCILPFAFLLESLFNNNIISIEEMNNRYELFKKYIYNYRPIKGDGNCFYRAVIFRYFELIIIHKQIDLLKNIINEMNESFNSNEIRSRLKIRYNFELNCRLVLLILIIILNLLEEGKIQEAHLFFVKSIVVEDSFDYGLIIYFRYIFYLYIKQNENKIYLENFAIKIGNLLPSNYETDKGLFLFNKFYYLYLLSMFTDAEKIIIHLTPFVLGINLDIIIFNDNEDKTIKNMIYAGDSDYNFNDDKIFVLNINGHYELLYSEEDNTKNIDLFKNYINDYYSNIRIKDTKKEEIDNKNKSKLKKEEDEKEKSENNVLIESSSIPLKGESNKKELKAENNIKNIIDEKNEEEINKINEKNKNIKKHRVQIKIINRTTVKPNKSFYNEIERNKDSNIIFDNLKYSEQKDINYKNLINSKNIEENNNNINQDNDEKNINNNNLYKSINIPKMNLIEIINKEIKDEKDKKENENSNAENQLINSKEKEEINILNSKKNQKMNNNVNENSCKICSKNYNKENNNELFLDVCQNCLKTIIINELSKKYLSYMEDLISNKMYAPAFITYFDEFLESKLNIFEKSISIKDILIIFDDTFKSNLEMHPLFQQIKKKFCIYCLGNIEKTIYEIPCKCNFCCIEDIKKYFHLKNNFKTKTNYICICSHQYSLEDIYNIGIFFLQNKLYSLKEEIIDYLNHNFLEKQCCFCSISFENHIKKRIKIKDFKDEIVLGDTNKLKHFQCLNCNALYKYNVDIFSCFICNKNHMIIDN